MEPYSKVERYSCPSAIRLHKWADDVWGGAVYDVTSRFYNTSAVGDSFLNGYKLPNYRDIIRAGGQATTPAAGVKYVGHPSYHYSKVLYRRFSPPLYGPAVGADEVDGFPIYDGLFGGDPLPSADQISETENLCIRRFLDQCRSAQASLRGESIAELGQTLRMITNPLSSIRKLTVDYLTNLRKARPRIKGRKRKQSYLADTYLEYTFGVIPLANDIESLIKHAILEQFDRVRVFGQGDLPFASSEYNWDPSNGKASGYTIRGHGRSVSTYTMRIIGQVKTGAVNGSIPVPQNLGLQLREIVPTLYAVLPYSFVVDYFLNVGSVIDALSFRFADLIWGNVTRRRSVEYVYATGPFVFNYFPSTHRIETAIQTGGSSKFTKVTFSRSAILPSDLLPTLRFSVPFGSKPWVNIAALLKQNLRGLHPF